MGKISDRKKVAFVTLGCKVNQYETNAMIQQFKNKGYEIVEHNEKADIYVINTCTVTNMSDRKSRQMIRRMKEQNKDGIIVACGCYVQVAQKEIEDIEEIDIAIGNNEKSKIVEIVEDYEKKTSEKTEQKNSFDVIAQDVMQQKEFVDLGDVTYTSKTRAAIKIQDGCDRFCSYCIIPVSYTHLVKKKEGNKLATNRKLGRTTDIRMAMLKTLTTDLILNGKVETTLARAKEVKAIADSIISLAIKEKDNFEMVDVKVVKAKLDSKGNKETELIKSKNGKEYLKVVKEETTEKRQKDMPSRLNARRKIMRKINKVKDSEGKNIDLPSKLFNEIAPKYAGKNVGGFTRIIKAGPRRGDGAEMAILQLI